MNITKMHELSLKMDEKIFEIKKIPSLKILSVKLNGTLRVIAAKNSKPRYTCQTGGGGAPLSVNKIITRMLVTQTNYFN